MKCFIFDNKECDGVIDATSCDCRKNHANHLHRNFIAMNLEEGFKNIQIGKAFRIKIFIRRI